MDDLIKRQNAIRVVREYMTENQITDGDWHAYGIERELHELPSAEPVIRCKDCEHDSYCCRLSSRTPNDYCSHAKRRTDERFNQ